MDNLLTIYKKIGLHRSSRLLASLVLALTSTTVFAAGNPFNALQEQINTLDQQVGTLNQELNNLSATVDQQLLSTLPVTVAVNCGAGESIGDVLSEHASGIAPLTINVEGTCVESIFILRANVTLNGSGTNPSDTVLQSTLSNFGSLTISRGARNVTVNNMQLSGGLGVIVSENSQAIFNNVDFTGSTYGLLSLNSSTAAVQDSLAHGNSIGLLSIRGGLLTVINSVIEQNNIGILANEGSNVHLTSRSTSGATGGGSSVSNNFTGIVGMTGSRISLIDTAVDSNTNIAAYIHTQASINLTATINGVGNSFSNNGNGIYARRNTSILISDSTNTITNNAQYGIQCTADTAYFPPVGGPGTVSGNGLADIDGCTGP